MEQDAQHKQERVQEYILEQLSVNSSLMLWLLPVEPFETVEDTLAANILPRVCTSRTVDSDKRAPMGKLSKRELKIMIIEQAISSFEAEDATLQVVVNVEKKRNRDFSAFKV
jgi:hypothetical protein